MDVKSFRAGTTTRRRATRCSLPPIRRGRRSTIAHSEDKKRVHLNRHLASAGACTLRGDSGRKVKLPKRKIGHYKSPDYPFKVIPECLPVEAKAKKARAVKRGKTRRKRSEKDENADKA